MKILIPTRTEFRKGVIAYRTHEKRDAVYRVASFLVAEWRHCPSKLSDAIGVLLFSWHQAHYRFGLPNLDSLEQLIARQHGMLERFRVRDIASLACDEANRLEELFNAMLDALAIASGKCSGRRSPVAAAKALHLFAPRFFPIWDEAIARRYRCPYAVRPFQAYLRFMHISRDMINTLQPSMAGLLEGKTPLKVLDEYNYARITKN